jgi:Golgi SNAP receptor complex protein 2
MDKTYRETKTSLLQINDLLSKLDKAFDLGEIDATKYEISKRLSEINGSFDQLDLYVIKEPVSKRYDAKMRVDQLKYDFTHYRTAFNTIVQRKYVLQHYEL